MVAFGQMLRAAGFIKILGIEEVSAVLCELVESPFDWVSLRDVNREVRSSIVSPWAVSVRLLNNSVEGMTADGVIRQAGRSDPGADVILWALHNCDFTGNDLRSRLLRSRHISRAMSCIVLSLQQGRCEPVKARWWDLGDVALANIRRCLPSCGGLAIRATCRGREPVIRSFLVKRGCIKIILDALDVENLRHTLVLYRDTAVLASLLSYVCHQSHLRRRDCVDVICHILDRHCTCSIVQGRCLIALRALSRPSLSVVFNVNIVDRIKTALENHHRHREVVHVACAFIGSLCDNVVLGEEKMHLKVCLRETKMIESLIYCQHEFAAAGDVHGNIWRTIRVLLRVLEAVEVSCIELLLQELSSILRMRCAKEGSIVMYSSVPGRIDGFPGRWGSALVLIQVLEVIICDQDHICSISEDLMDLVMEYFGRLPERMRFRCGFRQVCRMMELLSSRVDWAQWICRQKVAVFLLEGIGSLVRRGAGSRDVLFQICAATELLPWVLFCDRSQYSLCVHGLWYAMGRLSQECSFQIIACRTIKKLIWDEQTRHVIGECEPLYKCVMISLIVHGDDYELREEACGALITLLAFYVQYGGDSWRGAILGELGIFPADSYVRQQICEALGVGLRKIRSA